MTAWKTDFNPKRKGRPRLATNGLRRITKPGRKLPAAEIRLHEQRLRAEGRLGREVR
jgi:hypothetical protein